MVVDRGGKTQNLKKRSSASSNEFKKMKEERDAAYKQVCFFVCVCIPVQVCRHVVV